MSSPRISMLDGNEAVARVAYKLNEVVALYPITGGCAAPAVTSGTKPRQP